MRWPATSVDARAWSAAAARLQAGEASLGEVGVAAVVAEADTAATDAEAGAEARDTEAISATEVDRVLTVDAPVTNNAFVWALAPEKPRRPRSRWWTVGAAFALLALFIWTRGTLPRLRVDQLMNFAWKFMLPLSLTNLFAAAAWHYMMPGPALPRWLICIMLVVGPYLLLGRSLFKSKQLTKRVYRYAE